MAQIIDKGSLPADDAIFSEPCKLFLKQSRKTAGASSNASAEIRPASQHLTPNT